MKYCLSGRQPISVLKKCDEIKMRYEDRERIIDYIEVLPDKTIILEIPREVRDINWQLYEMYAEKINFILCVHDLSFATLCYEHNMQFYWEYPITSYYELNGVLALNPCYLFLGAPLCFELPKIKSKTDIAIRLCPNIAYNSYIPRENGICGQWIRPEDIKAYEPYVDTFEFAADELQREAVLLHIYKDNGQWPGNLNLLLTNFGFNVDNRGLPEEIGEMRTKCGQRCMSTGTCHFCETAVKFSEALRKKHIEMQQED